jgi:hypothetical protein
VSDNSNPNKPNVSSTNSKLIPRPQQRKLQRPYSPGREGFFDVMQELMFDKLTGNINQSETKSSHYATVYRIDEASGFLDSLFGAGNVRVRARIDSPDVAHGAIMIPDSFEDQAKINLLVEFEGSADDLGGKPKLGDIIEVDFYNTTNKTKMYGNGRIKKIITTSKVVGLDNAGNTGIFGAIANLFSPTSDNCAKPGNPSGLKTSPAAGATLSGENRIVTVSERNPRKLNSPTEDSTEGISQSRLPENQQASNIPAGSSTPTPQDNFANSRSSGPGPFQSSPGSNQDTPNGGPKKNDPCDSQIATVGAYRARKAEERGSILGRLTGDTNADGVPFTWDRETDRRIKKLHPDARQAVADFINFSAEQGYYLRVTETYRTIQRQSELYAKGRTVRPPNKPATYARGNPKSSIHQFGIAFDCVEVASGRDKTKKGKRFSTPGIGVSGFDKAYPKSRWQEIGAIGKQFGFVWGGNFRKLFDGPHFEVFRAKPSELRRKEARGRVVVDPDLGPNYKFPKF